MSARSISASTSPAYGNRKDFGFPETVTLDSYALVNATVRYRVNDGAHVAGPARERLRRGLHAGAGLSHRGPRVHHRSTLQLRIVSDEVEAAMGHRLSRIYTRTGDDGTTGLGDGHRVRKDHARVEAYGTVDEANSAIGMILAVPGLPPRWHAASRDPARPVRSRRRAVHPGHAESSRPDRIAGLEQVLDGFNDPLPPLKDFILPGGGPAAAACHLARTVVRRAERRVWSLADSRAREPRGAALSQPAVGSAVRHRARAGAARARQRSALAARSRREAARRNAARARPFLNGSVDQSKEGPGSVLRPGATSEWPTMRSRVIGG